MGSECGGDGRHLWEGNQGGTATAHGTSFFDLVHCHPNCWSVTPIMADKFLVVQELPVLAPPPKCPQEAASCATLEAGLCVALAFCWAASRGGRQRPGPQGWDAVLLLCKVRSGRAHKPVEACSLEGD